MTQEQDVSPETAGQEEATTSSDSSLNSALETFRNLSLDFKEEKKESAPKAEHSANKVSTSYSHCQWKESRKRYEYSHYRWRPYEIPCKGKSLKSKYNVADLLRRIRWREDVDVTSLKYSLVERLDIPCSVEANQPRMHDLEIDELSEYFGHFVRVGLKMSALAESMYC